MKTSKIRILTALAMGGIMACSLLARAEDTNKPAKPPGDHQGGPGGPRGDMRERAAKMDQELGLSEDQKIKMGEVRKEQGEKMKALREDQNLSQEDRHTKMQALREETKDKIKGILTADQFEKWQKMQQNRRGPGGPGGPGGDRPHGEGKPPGDKPADKE